MGHDRFDGSETVTVIRPSGRWPGLDLAEIWRYRDLLLILAERDLRLRYRQTALGVVWVLLQPLLGAAILAFVFGRIAGVDAGGLPYLPLAFAGLLGWGLFSTVVSRSTLALVNQPQLVSKVYFPRQLLPLATVLPALVDYAVAFIVLLALLLWHGMAVEPRVLLSLLWVVPLAALATGLGLFGSSLAVTYRDVGHVLPTVLQFAMFASPVAYRVTAVPPSYRALFLLNPLAPLLEALRSSLLGGEAPPRAPLALACVLSFCVLVGGLLFFGRRQRRLADVI